MNQRVPLTSGLGPAFSEGSNVLFGKTKFGKDLLKPRCIFSVPFVRLRGITKVVAQSRRDDAIERLGNYGLSSVRL